MKSRTRGALRLLASSVGIAVGAYVARVAATWFRFGHPRPAQVDEADPLLDRFMPEYEVVERHQVHVGAPAVFVFDVATKAKLRSAIINSIFKARELFMGAKPGKPAQFLPFLEQMESFGWRVLAEVPGREVVLGAATQPWEPEPGFHGLAPGEFVTFSEPNFVKIAFTLRADPAGDAASILRTETRVICTDAHARERFRRYWSLVSPGSILIRLVMLRRIKKEVERKVRAEKVVPISA
jgi:hypothetical protein